MSSKSAHLRAGICLGALMGPATYFLNGDLINALAVSAGALLGSSLPDQLEIAWHTGGRRKKGWFSIGYEDGIRHSLIPHRTITHWFMLWCLVLGVSILVVTRDRTPMPLFFLGLVGSGLLHVFMDSKTAMGVPILHPWRRTKGPHKSS